VKGRPSAGRDERRTRTHFVAVVAAIVAFDGCAQIVGITATEVASKDSGLSDATLADGSASDDGNGTPGSDAAPGTGDASSMDDPASPVDGNRPGDSMQVADTSGDRTSADGGGCTSNTTCPVNQPTCTGGQCIVRGPTMVQVAGTFYIDSTEVTVAQYQVFLTAKGTDTSGQPSVCSYNTSYQPAQALSPQNYPITNIDWCDALAYCTWAGKHLCGAIGGGPIAIANALTATKSQWFLACGGPNGGSHPNAN
jgi:hypothetical protein